MVLFLFCEYLGLESLGYTIRFFSHFLRNCHTAFQFTFSPAMYKGSSFSTFLPTLDIVCLFLLFFKYSCLHFHPTLAPHPTHPHLPPLNLPPLALSMCPLYMFLDDPSSISPRYPSPSSSLDRAVISSLAWIAEPGHRYLLLLRR